MSAAEQDYPDWKITNNTYYGSGIWEDQMAIHQEVYLMQLDGTTLRFKCLEALSNPIREGDQPTR